MTAAADSGVADVYFAGAPTEALGQVSSNSSLCRACDSELDDSESIDSEPNWEGDEPCCLLCIQ